MFRLPGLSPRLAAETLAALDRSHAVIEFDAQGTILAANDGFLAVLGYERAEVVGRRHSLFVDPADAAAPEYSLFWQNLRAGRHQVGQFRRLGKGGREVWIEASYSPVLDRRGRLRKIVKYATDVTARKQREAELGGQVDAINKALAVIHFDLDGIVRDANDNFLAAIGYARAEIVGRHHRMFVDAAEAASAEYAVFWDRLRGGAHVAAQFRRRGKGGREVWIEATYNPILDAAGRPFKVVKYATDVTAQVRLLAELKQLVDRNFGDMDRALDDSRTEAGTAAQAVHATAAHIQAMLASADELAASVREIADTMGRSRGAVDQAHRQIAGADEALRRLTSASGAMVGITELIRSIAGQINLLALNATIEAARAGEAGKGFAVVAGEVKSLARQAADATDRIGREIDGLQQVSDHVVAALGAIGGSVNLLLEHTAGTAGAVAQQSAVTQHMAASVQGTADSVAAIDDNMRRIAGSMDQVGAVIAVTRDAAKVLVR